VQYIQYVLHEHHNRFITNIQYWLKTQNYGSNYDQKHSHMIVRLRLWKIWLSVIL